MTTPIYIATGLGNIEQYKIARELFCCEPEPQYSITFDWTKGLEAHESGPKAVDDAMLGPISMAEQHAVRIARMVLMLLPGGAGTNCELGMAIAYDKPIVLVATMYEFNMRDRGFPSVFYKHPLVHHVQDLRTAKKVADMLRQTSW